MKLSRAGILLLLVLTAGGGFVLAKWMKPTSGGQIEPTDFVLINSVFEVCSNYMQLDAQRMSQLEVSWNDFRTSKPHEAALASAAGFQISKSIGMASESGEQSLKAKCNRALADIQIKLGRYSPIETGWLW